MTAKDVVLEFYKSDLLLDRVAVSKLLHPELIIEWNSSKGHIKMNFDDAMELTEELSKAYIRSKIKISHLIAEDNMVSVRYSHIVKTIENPREDMLLGNFFVIWEIKDHKLYKGFQMSHIY